MSGRRTLEKRRGRDLPPEVVDRSFSRTLCARPQEEAEGRLLSYRSFMFRDRRSAALDLSIAGFVTVVTTVLAWSDAPFFGDPLRGPQVVAALLPLFLGVPLAFRRREPLLMCCLVWGGLAIYCIASGVSPEGLECIVAFAVSSYSVAAYAPRREAVTGLAVIVACYAVYTVNTAGVRDVVGDQWASAFFATMTLACWLLGFGIHVRREEVALVQRARDLESQQAAAVQDERDRIARELHDIVSHRLGVVVVQAAGARAHDQGAGETLEKIEGQAREALVEMRRMLGLLRDDGSSGVEPQPGLAELPQLADAVTGAGLPVQLTVDGDVAQVPKAVGLSAYRIVQESLTNALRHSGAERASVRVTAGGDTLEVSVTDDGHGLSAQADGGHGLAGMRERAQLLGGRLDIEITPNGVTVHAVLPMACP
jgi:signal transduction histidine kinase